MLVRKRLVALTSLSCCLLGTGACTAQAAPRPAPSVYGTLTGTYIAGGPVRPEGSSRPVVLQLHDSRGHTFQVTTTADPDHHFSVQVPPGTYSVSGCGGPATANVAAGQLVALRIVCNVA